MKWVSLYTLGRPNGFTYFKAYLNASNEVVGWVNHSPYQKEYNVYAIDAHGAIVVSTRGTSEHADAAVEAAVVASPPKEGIGLIAFAMRT